MNPLGLECLSVFGLHPVEFIRLAAELGCGHVSLNFQRSANRLPTYPEASFRDDPTLRREIGAALGDCGVELALMEGFALTPQNSADDHAGDLDMTAELGAKAICAVSLDRDMGRTHAQFARLAEMAAARGLVATTEVGAGVIRSLGAALEAVRQVNDPGFRLLIDTMHFFRSGSTVADFAALDPAFVGHIQLCDVPMPAAIASYMEEALYERRAPGDGDLPLAEFIAHVPENVAIGLEVPIRSEAEAGIAPRERLERCVEAARRLLQAAERGGTRHG